jgi:hypothetical protein
MRNVGKMRKKNGKMSEDLLKTIDQIAMQAMMVEAGSANRKW